MRLLWLLRMRRWLEHPPSPRMVAFIIAVIAVCLALAAVELFVGWPEWLTPAGGPRGGVPRF